MHLADTIKDRTAYLIVAAALRGDHTAPRALLDDFAELEQLKEDGMGPGPSGRLVWTAKAAEQAAEKVAERLVRLSSYGGPAGIITEHLQPDLAACLDRFQTDRATAGRHAHSHILSIDMLTEPDDVRAAIARLHQITGSYGALRRSWAALRGGNPNPRSIDSGQDPKGPRSPLGECRNIADLVPHWEIAGGIGADPWPWGACPQHMRLGWLLDHGGDIWMPTAQQHNTLWRQLREEALNKGRLPQRRNAATGTAPGRSNL